MMTALIAFVTISLMIFLTGLYVAAEFATVSARRTKISQMAAQGDSLSRMLLPILEDSTKLDRYVAACQVGITITSLVLGAYAQRAIATRLAGPLTQLFGTSLSPEAAARLGHSASIMGILIFITALQVILSELFPKSLAIQYPEGVARALVWPMRISLALFAVPIWIFNGSANVLLRLAGRNTRDAVGRAHSPEEIELLVTESHEGGLLDDNERRLLRNALRMRDLTARQVMVHRTRIVAARLDTGAYDLMQIAIEGGFSRIPLYRDSIDEIVGFVHVKDVFRIHSQGINEVSSVIRDIVYVPETLPINDVWDQLDLQNRYLAVVFDEFGGTAGLLTLEDLIEEIFGELQDEFDDEAAIIARDKEGRIYLRGDLLISDVNEYLELELPEETADTLSGLVFSLLGRPPVEGDEVRFGDVVIHVETMEDLGVGELSLILPPSDADAHFTEWDMADHD
ncbi:MAG: HlyC/CorC family transporter [Candidatus Promineofilum sp.]|nr:HlyC/CorC family transporter [Promineifilum sp.]